MASQRHIAVGSHTYRSSHRVACPLPRNRSVGRSDRTTGSNPACSGNPKSCRRYCRIYKGTPVAHPHKGCHRPGPRKPAPPPARSSEHSRGSCLGPSQAYQAVARPIGRPVESNYRASSPKARQVDVSSLMHPMDLVSGDGIGDFPNRGHNEEHKRGACLCEPGRSRGHAAPAIVSPLRRQSGSRTRWPSKRERRGRRIRGDRVGCCRSKRQLPVLTLALVEVCLPDL
jgi:hypothetical protein